jgi:hypothetical protein
VPATRSAARSAAIRQPAADIVITQEGVLTSAQATTLFGRGNMRAQLAARRWQGPATGVVVMHNGPLTAAQRAWTALLSCAPGAALGGLTALEFDGFEGFLDEVPTVVLPNGADRPTYQAVHVHWSTRLGSSDVHPLRQPRRTRRQRSLLDAASWSRFERRARAVILAGVQQRVVSPQQLRDALRRRGPCRHRALILESIADAEGGVHSLPETDFDVVRRRRRLPRPDRQLPRRHRDGRFYLDASWDDYDAADVIPDLWTRSLGLWWPEPPETLESGRLAADRLSR